ncbi:MAG TPA: TMEM165/GDT1 family protein [Bacillota bacterium]|nr:TMEM165/GDT1 family protein [Bacillota bacterium]HPT87161.1 TMEM165/GDT1 family protein [Bacillota bacterium]
MSNLLNWHIIVLAFTTLFFAEMGDKTQLAVITLVADSKAPLSVFIGASAALTVVSLIGVVFGCAVTKLVPTHFLKFGAGILFVGIGLYTLWETFTGMVR